MQHSPLVSFLNIEDLFYRIFTYIKTLNSDGLIGWITSHWSLVIFISLLLSAFVFIGIIYLHIKLKEVAKKDAKIFDTVVVYDDSHDADSKNERWLSILRRLDFDSETEWKSAILDADIILNEMTTKMGYHGESLGERLTGVEKSDFLTIDLAWEAHKIRNIIAHEGSEYSISKREAKRVIDLYRQVFEEFEFI
ncbi:hypothetical protein A2442_02230 [Candidatus Campbellbacteria bacterium RIFOXYC2_FULL_35_25]|uniref:Uncharacterized protein n=1 Tax=Candidatus Campbellbacteria bacterium RIFOXYC2_FULL_35_25 TaxID=1797582 RepID=A0A1F5EIF4_9BACT|nr:MAG: hypothetical protein A2442_02230 [Candidatus Campbellbacteria bacterium RIFOXYC2_FULL_35_25]